MKQVIGVDVSKRRLDMYGDCMGYQSIDNTLDAITAFLETLSQDTLIACEATGGYEDLLIRQTIKQGIAIHRAHPNKVRAFAKARGRLAKTDYTDAQVIADYAQTFDVEAFVLPDEAISTLRAILRRRQQLIEIKQKEKANLDKSAMPHIVVTSIKENIASIETQIQQLDAAYQMHLTKHSQLQHQVKQLQSVKGFGELTAARLISELPELGNISHEKLTALVGLAPWSNDSGKRQGYRAIKGGRYQVRNLLYMSALVAIRHNPPLKTFYEKLKRKGKASKVALVAVMRKLIIIANAIIKRDAPWQVDYPTTK